MTEPTESPLPATTEDGGGGALSVLGEWLSGIPKALQKPFAKAVGRLAMGAVEWPAAYFEARAKDIKHQQNVKEKVRNALAKQAIAQVPQSPEITERALQHFAADVLGKQFNREEVLRHAAEELAQGGERTAQEQTASDSPDRLDDDWLNSFSQYAERASTERMQSLFGMILAGEIRNPGKYSLFTIDFLAKINKRDAEAITFIAPFHIAGLVPRTDALEKIISQSTVQRLVNLGVISPTSTGHLTAALNFEVGAEGIVQGRYCALAFSERNVVFFTSPQRTSISISGYSFTELGREVLTLHTCDLHPLVLTEISKVMKNSGVDVLVGDLLPVEIDQISGEKSFSWKNVRPVRPK